MVGLDKFFTKCYHGVGLGVTKIEAIQPELLLWIEMQGVVWDAKKEGRTVFWSYLGGLGGRPLDTRCISLGKFFTKSNHTRVRLFWVGMGLAWCRK